MPVTYPLFSAASLAQEASFHTTKARHCAWLKLFTGVPPSLPHYWQAGCALYIGLCSNSHSLCPYLTASPRSFHLLSACVCVLSCSFVLGLLSLPSVASGGVAEKRDYACPLGADTQASRQGEIRRWGQ
jgi:hypothetical protein